MAQRGVGGAGPSLGPAPGSTGPDALAVYFADMRRSAAEGGRRLWEVCGFECAAPFELRADATEWVLLPRQPMMLQSSAFRRESYLGVGGMRADLRSRHDSHLFFKLCIGQPSCAVNHCGTEMTADDESGGRVTEAIGTRTPEYHLETVRLYRDVIDSFPHLSARYRAALRGRLSSAHVWLSKHRFGEWRLLRGVSHLAAATVASPRRVFGGLGRKARPTG